MRFIELEDLKNAGIKLAVNIDADSINTVPTEVLSFFANMMNPSPLFNTTVQLTTLKNAYDEYMEPRDIEVDFDNEDDNGVSDGNYLVVIEGGSAVKLYYEYMKYCIENPHCMGAISGVDPIRFVLDDDAEKFYQSKL